MRQLIGLTLLAVILLSSCTENEMTFDDNAIVEENQLAEIEKMGILVPADDLKGKIEKGLDPYYFYSSEEDDDPQIILIPNGDYAVKSDCDKKLVIDPGWIDCYGDGNTCKLYQVGDGVAIKRCQPGDETM
jgi:hypothetical protein